MSGNTALENIKTFIGEKMAKIEIAIQEAKALRELMKDAKVSVPIGYLLGSLMIKVEQAIGKEQEKALKSKYTKKESKSKKSGANDED